MSWEERFQQATGKKPEEVGVNTEEEARAYIARVNSEKKPGLIQRAMQAASESVNFWDALHPEGTGTTRRGFNDIFPKPPGYR